MSDTPIFNKRTKSRTIRARDEGTENQNDTSEEPKTVVSNFKNKNKNRTKPQQRLSFNAEDEKEDGGEVFLVKKSNLSKRMKSGIGASPMASPGLSLSSKLADTTISNRSEGPKYDAQYLSELRASTNSARPISAPQNGSGPMDVDSLTFDANEIDGAVIENYDDMPLVSTNTAEAIIPSESAVKAAKEKRERSRKTGVPEGGEEDYISLTVARKEDMYQGPHPESRLMREDDDLGEGDDDDADFTGAKERIALSKKGRKEEEKKRKKGIVELIEEADEQDEEAMEWEMAQVKRAVPAEARAAKEEASRRTYKAQPIPTPTPIPTLDAAILRIDRTLNAMTTSHTQNATSIASLTEEHLAYDNEEADLRRQVSLAEEKRAWFQQFHERMENIGEFLEEKYPGLETLEKEHVSLLTERADMIEKRRTQDNEDDLVLLFGVPNDIMSEDGGTDELGRALPESTHPQSPNRRERRRERSQRHSNLSSKHGAQEGYASDSNLSPSDESDFQMAISSLKDKIQTKLFEDVKAKAFKDPKHGIMLWFKEWQEKYPDLYTNAFGGMGLVQAWEFWGRVELLGWLPLDHEPRLEEFKWYTRLHEYSHPGGEEEEDIRPEDDLPVQMISTMLIPRFNTLITGGAFDPYSAKQIPHLIDLTEQIEASVGSDNNRFSSLLTTVSRVFRKAATDLIEQFRRFSTSNQSRPTFDPESIPARQRYMNRIIKLVDDAMKWRKYTKERDGLGNIVSELTEVLFDVAQAGWEVGGEETIRKVISTLPTELVPVIVRNRLG